MKGRQLAGSARLAHGVIVCLVLWACSLPALAAQQERTCIVGELPVNAMPLEFVSPKIPLACWRAEREGDGSGVFLKAVFDVTPEGKTENIVVEYTDPACASDYIANMIAELRYACSDLGRKGMRLRMTISSIVG